MDTLVNYTKKANPRLLELNKVYKFVFDDARLAGGLIDQGYAHMINGKATGLGKYVGEIGGTVKLEDQLTTGKQFVVGRYGPDFYEYVPPVSAPIENIEETLAETNKNLPTKPTTLLRENVMKWATKGTPAANKKYGGARKTKRTKRSRARKSRRHSRR